MFLCFLPSPRWQVHAAMSSFFQLNGVLQTFLPRVALNCDPPQDQPPKYIPRFLYPVTSFYFIGNFNQVIRLISLFWKMKMYHKIGIVGVDTAKQGLIVMMLNYIFGTYFAIRLSCNLMISLPPL
jgi:hypothetical protein